MICGSTDSLISGIPMDLTVLEVHYVLERHLGILSEEQYLVYKGKVLDRDATLIDCEVQDDAMLFLVSKSELDSLDQFIEQEAMIEQVFEEFTEAYDLPLDIVDDNRVSEEMDRLVDLSLMHCEMSRKGMIEMTSIYREIESQCENCDTVELSVIPEQCDGPSVDPLPMLFFNDEDNITSETMCEHIDTGLSCFMHMRNEDNRMIISSGDLF